MIKLSPLNNSVFVTSSPIITSDIGEITKIEDDSYYECGLRFYDSKGETFRTGTKWNAVRCCLMCAINDNRERDDLIPQKYKQESGHIYAACNDPRVIWACLVSLWITYNISKNKDDTNEARTKVLTSLLPTYQEACVWMVRNRFQLFTTTNEMYDKICSPSGSLYRDPYYKDYSALKTPPKIDWSIFPDRKDS